MFYAISFFKYLADLNKNNNKHLSLISVYFSTYIKNRKAPFAGVWEGHLLLERLQATGRQQRAPLLPPLYHPSGGKMRPPPYCRQVKVFADLHLSLRNFMIFSKHLIVKKDSLKLL